MKTSIRTKFILGIVFFFIIIALLSIMSAYQLNKLSKKTSSVLKENELSVIYARDMFDQLTNINQEIINSYLTNKPSDDILINKSLDLFDKSLSLEKNNITEVGEDKLASTIEAEYKDYRDSLTNIAKSPHSTEKVTILQKKYRDLDQQLMLLSQLNEKAMNLKIADANTSAKHALLLMTILGTVCFLIALSFTYSFALYFNDRFSQLYNGIKEIAASNYGQRLHFDGKDEFKEISIVFNRMAEKLHENRPEHDLTGIEVLDTEKSSDEIQELKKMISQIRKIEEQAYELISKLENKK